MPFQRPTLQELNDRIKADFAVHYNAGKPLSPRTLPSVLATTIAGAAHMLHGHIDSIAKEIFPDTCSTESLERMAHIRGIYRRTATQAEGVVQFQGNSLSFIPQGTELIQGDTATLFETLQAVRTVLDGLAQVRCRCKTPGRIGNIHAGEALTLVKPIRGVNSATVAEDFRDGFEQETHDDLLRRYILRLRNPMCGGTRKDFEQMTKQVEGVKNVWVTENIPVNDRVNICFSTTDLNATIPTPEHIQKVTDHVELNRPLLAKINVFRLTPQPIVFRIQLNRDSQELKNAIETSLKRLIFEEAKPGGMIRHSHVLLSITKHIRRERGETFTLLTPTEDVQVSDGHIAKFGTMGWEV